MNNYFVVSVSSTEYNVIERATNLIIRGFRSVDHANQFCLGLNSGGGFDGFTPLFVVKQYNYINTD